MNAKFYEFDDIDDDLELLINNMPPTRNSTPDTNTPQQSIPLQNIVDAHTLQESLNFRNNNL